MKITAQDLHALGVIDGIVPEPLGGAHRDKAGAIKLVGEAVPKSLGEFDGIDAGAIRAQRHDKFLDIGRTL